jgi:hypothetical protein
MSRCDAISDKSKGQRTEERGFDSLQRRDIHCCSVMSVYSLRPAYYYIKCLLDCLCLALKRPERYAVHSPPSMSRSRTMEIHRKSPHDIMAWGFIKTSGIFILMVIASGPPVWSSGQSSSPLTQKFLVRFPALPNFLPSSGSGTVSTQPREDK